MHPKAYNWRDKHRLRKGNHVLQNIIHLVTNSEAKGIKITTFPDSSTSLKQSREVLAAGMEECVCAAHVCEIMIH